MNYPMLTRLQKERGLDAPWVMIEATHKLIDYVWRKKLDDYRISGDALINKFQRENKNYNTLVIEFILLDLQ